MTDQREQEIREHWKPGDWDDSYSVPYLLDVLDREREVHQENVDKFTVMWRDEREQRAELLEALRKIANPPRDEAGEGDPFDSHQVYIWRVATAAIARAEGSDKARGAKER